MLPLNYTVLSNESSYSRDALQSCIKEILLSMSHSLFTRKNIRLDFCEVGRIVVRDSKIQMKFFRNFVKELGELQNAFRLNTAKSEISPLRSRLSTASEYSLPR